MNALMRNFFYGLGPMSLVVACGGRAVDSGEDVGTVDDTAGPAREAVGNASPAGGSGSFSGGGGGSSPAGGTSSIDGGEATGGSYFEDDVTKPSELGCPPAQWTCDENSSFLNHQHQGSDELFGYTQPTGCRCDESRPLSPVDCDFGTHFTCWTMRFLDEYTAFDREHQVGCECAVTRGACSYRCSELEPQVRGFIEYHDCTSNAEDVTLCLGEVALPW